MNAKTPVRLLSGLLLLTSAASANLIQVQMSGAITNSNLSVFPVNQALTVTFTYDSVGSPQLISNLQAFYVDHFTSVTLSTGAYSSTATGSFGQIDKYDNLSNTDGINFQFGAVPAAYQFTNPKPHGVPLASVFSNNVTQTFDNMNVVLASSSNAVWSGYALPTTLNLASFDTNHSVNVAFSGGGFGATFTSLSATDVSTAPEPGTLGLIGCCLAGLAGLRRARR